MPDFRIKCTGPKYAIGDFQIAKFEDVPLWLNKIKGLAKGVPGTWLFSLAKDGRINSHSAREHVEIQSDTKDYFLAREVAFQTGLLRTRGFSEVLSKDSAVALSFAQELDSRYV